MSTKKQVKSRQQHVSRTADMTSRNSGSYNPGAVEEYPELDGVRAQQNDLQLEEFADGPYGAATTPEKMGKSTPWKTGQRTVSAFRDANPAVSRRKSVEEESDFNH